MPPSTTGALEWSVAGRPLAGERVSGDGHAVVEGDAGVLASVIDGLGHGEEAHEATVLAVETLARAAGADLNAVLRECHEVLVRSRGVVMSLALVHRDRPELTWVGVGNVEGVRARRVAPSRVTNERLFLKGGVVGHNLPNVRPSTTALEPGDVLVFATDGVRVDFADALPECMDRAADVAAHELLRRFAKDTDDALVLFARYRGPGLPEGRA